MVQASFEAEYAAAADQRAERHRRRGVRRGEDAEVGGPGEVPAGERRRLSALRVRRGAAADRAARSRRTSASRSPSPKPAAGTRTSTREPSVGQLAGAARRLRPRHRGARPRPRRSHGRRRDPDDVGVRPRGGRERQPRHRSRPRQRDDDHRRPERPRRQGLRPLAGPRARAALRRPRPRGHDRLPQRLLRKSCAAISALPTARSIFPGFDRPRRRLGFLG